MSHKKGNHIWLTLGLFAVLAMNVNFDDSNHQIRLARAQKTQTMDLASEQHKVRIGQDCRLNLKGSFDEGIITAKGTVRDYKLNCSSGKCGSDIPESIKVIRDVKNISDLAKRLEETVTEAGYECVGGQIVRKEAQKEKEVVAKKATKKDKGDIDYYALLDKKAEKCTNEDETIDELECYSGVIESAADSSKFRKGGKKASRAMVRFFNKNFKKEFATLFNDKSADIDRLDLWDSLARIMAVKNTKTGRSVAGAAKKLKNSLIAGEAKKLIEMRNNLNAVCSGLIGQNVNVQLMDTFKCNTLKRQLPQASKQIQFDFQHNAIPTLANAYTDLEVAKSAQAAQVMARQETFDELYRQFSNFSKNAVSNTLNMPTTMSRQRPSSSSLSAINATLGQPQSDILSRLMKQTITVPGANNVAPKVVPNKQPAPTVKRGSRFSINSRTRN